MKRQKRVVAIHDISGFGKCSLTVALPIISAAGIETAVLPTAVLSTHTGGIPGFTYRDLTEDIEPIAKHWKDLNLSFDAIYTGFLGSFEQLELISTFFDDFKSQDNIIFVDPVMADHGKLYSIFTPEFAKGMTKLSSKADILVPNMTEALIMLDEEYKEGPYTDEFIENILLRLSQLGPKQIVLTGVYFDEKLLGAATYDKDTDKIGYAFADRIEGAYHGTGDVFGSALLGAILNGFSLLDSAVIAVNFTTESIQKTADAKTDIRFGVNFEESIPNYLVNLGKFKSRFKFKV
ncbi:pyridoxamine kinase [Bacteroidales bacterium OttesenSCG-928-I21]|nr:pyridoxamine kinase [Bacteroidales bacterium OttesenSCG-928-I21]